MIDSLLRHALALEERSGGQAGRMAARIRNRIGRNAFNGGNFIVAEQMFRDAARIGAAQANAMDIEHAAFLGDLGAALREQHRFAEAWPPVCQSLAIRVAALPADDLMIAASLNNMGRIALGEGRHAEAYGLMARAYDINAKTLGLANATVQREARNLDAVRRMAGGQRSDADHCGAAATS